MYLQSAPREVPPHQHHPGTAATSSRHSSYIIAAWQLHHHGTAATSWRHGSYIMAAQQLHHCGTAATSSWHGIFIHPRVLEPARSPKLCHESRAFLFAQNGWRNKIPFICLLKIIFISRLWTACPQRLSSSLGVNPAPLSDAETPLSSEILCSPPKEIVPLPDGSLEPVWHLNSLSCF